MKGLAIFVLILSLLMGAMVIYFYVKHGNSSGNKQNTSNIIHHNNGNNGNHNEPQEIEKCYKCQNKQCVEFSPCPSPYKDPGFPYYENQPDCFNECQ